MRAISRTHIIAMSIALVLLAGVGIGIAFVDRDRGATITAGATTILPGRDDVGGTFTLVDHTGTPVTDADFGDQLTVVYFGFTYCPDFCPTQLALIARALDLLGEEAAGIQPVLITIDPARDTPEALADYVDLFHPSMVGLTGTEEQVAAAVDAYRAYYARIDLEDGGYTMDHSTLTYVMGPDGSNVAIYPHGLGPEIMADHLRSLLAETSA